MSKDVQQQVAPATVPEEDKPPKVQWETMKEASLLNDSDVKLLNQITIDIVDENSLKQITKTVLENADAFSAVFCKVLNSVQQDAYLKFITFAIDVVQDFSDRDWKGLAALKESFQNKLYDTAVKTKTFKSLLNILDKTDIYLLERAFRVLGRLFDYDIRNFMESELLNKEQEAFVECINREMQYQGNIAKNAKMATFALVLTIRKENMRETFYKLGGIKNLMALLDKHSTNIQIIYEVCFCIWVMSYSKSRVPVYFQDIKLVPIMHNILKNVQTEKIVRVVLCAFRNFLGVYGMINEMISVGVPKTLGNLTKRKFEDTDIEKENESLSKTLEQYIEEISSFDEYRQEVLSGNLEWTPVHTSEKFWKENLTKLESNNFYILKELIKLLETNTEASAPSMDQVPASPSDQKVSIKNTTRTLAIAAHDIGQFVRYHPRGRKIIGDLGAKAKVIALMEHDDAEVKKQALLATQKIMIMNWDYLEKS